MEGPGSPTLAGCALDGRAALKPVIPGSRQSAAARYVRKDLVRLGDADTLDADADRMAALVVDHGVDAVHRGERVRHLAW